MSFNLQEDFSPAFDRRQPGFLFLYPSHEGCVKETIALTTSRIPEGEREEKGREQESARAVNVHTHPKEEDGENHHHLYIYSLSPIFLIHKYSNPPSL